MGRPSSYQHIPWLDNVLTGSIFFLTALSLYTFSAEKDDLVLFVSAFLCTTVLIRICKFVFRKLAFVLGTERAVSKPRNVRKFADQGWQLTIHTIMTIWEAFVLQQEDWESWHEPNRAYDGREISYSLRALYICQLGVWLYTSVSHRFFEARHKDYYVMYIHHVATVGLIIGSWISGYVVVGLLVLYVHDFPDIFADLVKMFNYLERDSSTGFPFTEVTFASVIVSWFYFRLYEFPRKVIYFSIWHSGSGSCGDQDLAASDPLRLLVEGDTSCNVLRALLVVLLCLHWYWFVLFLRLVYRIVTSDGVHDAAADEYEGASSDSALEVDEDSKKRN